MSNPKVSVICPIHDMKDGDKFLWRLVNSLTAQTFTDWELIITKDGRMAENTNAGIKRARGELVKILYLDDWFAHQNSLKDIVDVFDKEIWKQDQWLITATNNNLYPQVTDDIETGNNKLGSPSALTFRNHFEANILFDEKMSWLLDCDYYKRLIKIYGKPIRYDKITVNIGEHDGQMTHILTEKQKLAEHEYMRKKYE